MTITDIAFGMIPIANILAIQTMFAVEYIQLMTSVWAEQGDNE